MKTLLNISGMDIAHKDGILYKAVSFDICEGDCILVCGPNGCGKTTLLRMLASMKTSDWGEAALIPTRIPKVKGFTLREFVSMASRDAFSSDTDEAIARMGLERLSGRDISVLSDGEFQRAAIASALVRRASVLLLDEPTAFLDVENKRSVMRLLRSVCEVSTGGVLPAVVFTSHDIYDGLKVASKVIALGRDGLLRMGPPSEELVASAFGSGLDFSLSDSFSG